MADRGYSEEQWKAACENARVEQCVDCEGQAYYNIHGVVDHDKHWPPLGDPATVLAMLRVLVEKGDGATKLVGYRGIGDGGTMGHRCWFVLPTLGEGFPEDEQPLPKTSADIHDSPEAAIVLACAALPKEG